MLMRTLGFASKIKPRVSRGIGHAVTATRHIGTAARHIREIGAAVNGATGNVGTQSSSLIMGGQTDPSYTAATEEWNGPTAVTKTVTVS